MVASLSEVWGQRAHELGLMWGFKTGQGAEL